jgi:hypothetical protein
VTTPAVARIHVFIPNPVDIHHRALLILSGSANRTPTQRNDNMAAVTTPIKQREAAKSAVAGKAKKPVATADLKADHKQKAAAIMKEKKAAPPKPMRDRSKWKDASGQEIVKGVTVKADGKAIGTAAYFHTHEVDGEKVGMVGVALSGKGDALKVGGRAVKNRSFRADELTAVPE